MMDWRRYPYRSSRDPEGIGNLLDRLDAEVEGGPLQGTRFVHDAGSMHSTLRELEARGAGVADELYVGFRDASNLEREQDVYSAITSAGTKVLGFGTGQPEVNIPGLRWVSVPKDPLALTNQRFLVTRDPEPTACVGFATGGTEAHSDDEETADAGEAGDAGSRAESSPPTWEGFSSRDPRVVEALLDYLGGLATARISPA
jgi:hypothetical protein